MLQLEQRLSQRFPHWFRGRRAAIARPLLRGIARWSRLDEIDAFLAANRHLRGFEFVAFTADVAGIVEHLHIVGRHTRERAPDLMRPRCRAGTPLVAQHTGIAAETDQHRRTGLALRVRAHHIEQAPRVAGLAAVDAAAPDRLSGPVLTHYRSIHFRRRPSVSGTSSNPTSDTRPQPMT